MMPHSIEIPDIDPELKAAIDLRAAQTGQSVSETVRALLSEALGVRRRRRGGVLAERGIHLTDSDLDEAMRPLPEASRWTGVSQ